MTDEFDGIVFLESEIVEDDKDAPLGTLVRLGNQAAPKNLNAPASAQPSENKKPGDSVASIFQQIPSSNPYVQPTTLNSNSNANPQKPAPVSPTLAYANRVAAQRTVHPMPFQAVNPTTGAARPVQTVQIGNQVYVLTPVGAASAPRVVKSAKQSATAPQRSTQPASIRNSQQERHPHSAEFSSNGHVVHPVSPSQSNHNFSKTQIHHKTNSDGTQTIQLGDKYYMITPVQHPGDAHQNPHPTSRTTNPIGQPRPAVPAALKHQAPASTAQSTKSRPAPTATAKTAQTAPVKKVKAAEPASNTKTTPVAANKKPKTAEQPSTTAKTKTYEYDDDYIIQTYFAPKKTKNSTNKNNTEENKMAKEKTTTPETVIVEGDPNNPHGKFVIKRTDNNNFVFKLFSANKRVVAISAGAYASLSSCKSGIQSVINNAANAPIEDQTLKNVTEQKCPKWVVYQDKREEYRLRLIASNGNMVAMTNDGYTNKDSAKKGIDAIARAAQGADIVRNDDLW